jgi:ferredoxin
MKKSHYTSKSRWDEAVAKLLETYQVYAPVETWGQLDYKLIDKSDIEEIIYNKARPTTPLKSFLLPIKENVTRPSKETKRIILGVPQCDLKALELLDTMYLGNNYVDPSYESNRKNTYIIGTDCHETDEHCHCTTYGVNPYPGDQADISLAHIGSEILLQTKSEQGNSLLDELKDILHLMDIRHDQAKKHQELRDVTTKLLNDANKDLPDQEISKQLVSSADQNLWVEFSENCVSCGACSTVCPTCTCFLLIDKPGFEKIRSIDTCQHPGFERVAAGENPLENLGKRFRNRYMCKFVWRPEKFDQLACTGCGRCIDACIGNINKNEVLLELSTAVKTY